MSETFAPPIRLWHDDIRPAPEGWTWARTNAAAIRVLSEGGVREISLDHDLGLHHYTEAQIEANQELLFGRGDAEETGLDLVRWMLDAGRVPAVVTIHSWNPQGAARMAAALNDAGHDVTVAPFQVPSPVTLDEPPDPRCAGCNRAFKVGDRYITDTSSGFTNNEPDPVVDDLLAGVFGGTDGKIRLCEDCTEPGGDRRIHTYYGDEDGWVNDGFGI